MIAARCRFVYADHLRIEPLSLSPVLLKGTQIGKQAKAVREDTAIGGGVGEKTPFRFDRLSFANVDRREDYLLNRNFEAVGRAVTRNERERLFSVGFGPGELLL